VATGNGNGKHEPSSVDAFDPTEGGKYCGHKTSSPDAVHEYCHQAAGAGTDHPGFGNCRKHWGGGGHLTHGRSTRYDGVARVRIRDLLAEQEQDPDPLNTIPELRMGRALFIDFVERYDEWREAILGWHASWQLSRRPLPADLLHAFGNVVDEWENAVKLGTEEPTERQLADVQSARDFVDFMRGAESTVVKPREVLDVSAAMHHLDVITKMVERVEKIRAANAISRKDFLRLTDNMGNSVGKHVKALAPQLLATTPLTPEMAEKAIHDALRKIREEWLELVAG